MRKVIGIGETVLDIIFRNEQPISAVPGGSTFNAIISLGRSGVSTSFISETGNDRVGRNIIQFLRDNGCEADAVNMYPDSKSPLSLAFLNEQNDAEYIFYKDHPHDRLDFNYPDVGLFGLCPPAGSHPLLRCQLPRLPSARGDEAYAQPA